MAAYGGANTPSNTTAGNIVGGSTYGDLSKNDAFVIQKKMLPIAKRLLTFARFAQKETKPPEAGFRDPSQTVRKGSQSLIRLSLKAFPHLQPSIRRPSSTPCNSTAVM